MTNAYATGDLLALARDTARRRLIGLSKSTRRFTPEQLTLLSSLLDEFARKSRPARTTQEDRHD